MYCYLWPNWYLNSCLTIFSKHCRVTVRSFHVIILVVSTKGCNIISEQKGHIIHTWSRRACNIILSQKKHVLSYLAKKKHVPFSIKRGMYHHALQKEKHVPSYLVQNECMHHNYPKYVPCFCAFWESDWKGYLKPSGMKFFEMVNIQVPCQVSALHVC